MDDRSLPASLAARRQNSNPRWVFLKLIAKLEQTGFSPSRPEKLATVSVVDPDPPDSYRHHFSGSEWSGSRSVSNDAVPDPAKKYLHQQILKSYATNFGFMLEFFIYF